MKQKLSDFLQNSEKIVVLTIGNELRGDDGLGPLFAQKLASIFAENNHVVVLDGGMVPENFTGTIRKENPSHVILFDAVEMDKMPGEVEWIEKDQIAEYNVSTHSMPISFLIKYLESTTPFQIILLGMQPKNMELGAEISPEVKHSIEDMVKLFNDVFNDINKLDLN